jgi:hypothetical protein
MTDREFEAAQELARQEQVSVSEAMRTLVMNASKNAIGGRGGIEEQVLERIRGTNAAWDLAPAVKAKALPPIHYSSYPVANPETGELKSVHPIDLKGYLESGWKIVEFPGLRLNDRFASEVRMSYNDYIKLQGGKTNAGSL